MVVVAGLAEAVAENETVTVQVGLQGLFVKLAVTPIGSPEVENVTGTVVPVTRVAFIDAELLGPPCTTIRLFGEGVERLKSKVGAAANTTMVEVPRVDAWVVSPE